MNAERVARLKESLDDPNLVSFEPWVVRELLDHIDGLKFANGVLDSAAKDAQTWSYEAQTAKEAYCELLEANRVTEEAGGVIAQLNGMIDELRAQLEAQRGVPERAAWLTIDEMEHVIERGHPVFSIEGPAIQRIPHKVARALAEAIAAASIAKGKEQRGGAVVVAEKAYPGQAERVAFLGALKHELENPTSDQSPTSFDINRDYFEHYANVFSKDNERMAHGVGFMNGAAWHRQHWSISASQVLQPGMVGVDREEWEILGRLHMTAIDFVNEADPAQRRAAAHLVQAVSALRQYHARSAQAGEVKG